jgi:protein phosphatase 2C family protein 2/3
VQQTEKEKDKVEYLAKHGDVQLVRYRGFVMTLQQQEEYARMEQEQIEGFINSYHPAKFACKRNGVVASYAANTHQGIVRNYNEDRVSIILNIIKPKFKQVADWPRCSFFAIYDGHGGAACADFLRDHLHQLIVRDENFPADPKKAI